MFPISILEVPAARFLFILRLYSGLERCFPARKRAPTGIPAIYTLLEKMNSQGIPCDVVLLGRSAESSEISSGPCLFPALPNLCFHTLPYGMKTRSYGMRASLFLRQLFFIARLLLKNSYALVYCDRVHVLLGACLSLLGFRVVLRLLGVANLCQEKPFRRGCLPNLLYWGFGSRFKAVIASIDGSPIDLFLAKRIHPSVPRYTWFNGVNPKDDASVAELSLSFESFARRNSLLVATGRLEKDKGIDVLISALQVLSLHRRDFCCIIVGEGSQRSTLEEQSRDLIEKGLIRFLGSVTHDESLTILQQADIAVSLNAYTAVRL